MMKKHQNTYIYFTSSYFVELDSYLLTSHPFFVTFACVFHILWSLEGQFLAHEKLTAMSNNPLLHL